MLATYDLPFSTVYVSQDGKIEINEKENGGYQAQSFEQLDSIVPAGVPQGSRWISCLICNCSCPLH